MSPPPAASTPSPDSLSLQYHQSNGAGAHGSSASPAADTVNVSVKTQHEDSMMLDDGEQRQSGDEGASDNDDDVAETVNRNGKRKRPISVSYVHCFSCVSQQTKLASLLSNVSFSPPSSFLTDSPSVPGLVSSGSAFSLDPGSLILTPGGHPSRRLPYPISLHVNFPQTPNSTPACPTLLWSWFLHRSGTP